MENMKNKFIRFLKDHHAFDEFKENLKKSRVETFSAFMKQNSYQPHKLFILAFGWHETKQGFNFWRELSMLWNEEVRKCLS